MNVLTKYVRQLIIEKMKIVDEKIRKVDSRIYAKKDLDNEWRLVRDAALILEDLIEGLNVAETDECDC